MAAITAAEIKTKYSVNTGAAGGVTTGSASTTWGGKYASNVDWAGGSLNDLFDDISGAENAANGVAPSGIDYRCIFVHNTNTLNALQNAVVWVTGEVAGGASVAIAVDTTNASLYTATPAQALAATTSENVPGASVTGLAYSTPTTQGTGLSLGSIPINNVKAVWIRRTTANSSAVSADGFTLNIAGDTGAA
jgi:hypothetical protein